LMILGMGEDKKVGRMSKVRKSKVGYETMMPPIS